MKHRKIISSNQELNRKRKCIAKDIWIIAGAIMVMLLQNPASAPAAIVVFLLALFGVFMFLDERNG